MKLNVLNLDGTASGTIELNQDIFGLDVRVDLLHRMVRYQLAKRRAGTHDVKNRSEIARTGKKIYKQKGSGGARHSSQRVNLFRGGGRSHGPTPRSHAHDLPKQVRALALRHALSTKAKSGELIVLNDVVVAAPKTKVVLGNFKALGVTNALFIDGAEVNVNFALSARNVPNIDVLPVQGINVYDILRRKKLVLTKAAVSALEERFQ
jgi:large subunit ribosomal protein L4